jgi:hypothetical protein
MAYSRFPIEIPDISIHGAYPCIAKTHYVDRLQLSFLCEAFHRRVLPHDILLNVADCRRFDYKVTPIDPALMQCRFSLEMINLVSIKREASKTRRRPDCREGYKTFLGAIKF